MDYEKRLKYLNKDAYRLNQTVLKSSKWFKDEPEKRREFVILLSECQQKTADLSSCLKELRDAEIQLKELKPEEVKKPEISQDRYPKRDGDSHTNFVGD